MLAVTLDLRGEDATYQRLKDLSFQAARFRNLFLRARWAEAKNLCVNPAKQIPHDVTKWIRADEKQELSGAAYSAAEREVAGVWQRHAKRILAGAPLPEWKPTAALSIRGHKNKNESGIRLSLDERERFIAHLQVQNAKCEGGCWLTIPLDTGTVKDHQSDKLRKMVEWEIPISKATVVMKPGKHKAILRLSYALTVPLPSMGNRVATLGPIRQGNRLCLRTECDTIDYSGRLHSFLDKKDSWDFIRRRFQAQIGRCKGAARAKRKKFASMKVEGWTQNFLHQWTSDIAKWLNTQGVARLQLAGLEGANWPAFKFTEQLKYKLEAVGITLEPVSLSDAPTERAIKTEINQKRRRVKKQADAIRTLSAAS